MPQCRSTKHNWLTQEDADKCCDPDWHRIVVYGKDVAQEGVMHTTVQHIDGTPYGYKWMHCSELNKD
jgi:hypothetical protein